MSPSEHDLRAALHDDEGSELNVDQLILHARARVAQRRVHLLSGAAIAIVVAAVGVGGALLANSTGGGQESAGNADAARGSVFDGHNHRASQGSAALKAPVAGGMASEAAVACPKTPPHYLLPGGGSPGQFGASGPMFKKPVSSIVVCAYGAVLQPVTQSRRYPAHFTLRDRAAQRVAISLENAPTRRPPQMCPDYRTADAQQIALIGFTSDGERAGTVTTTVGVPACATTVTNGTAIRYDWAPPAELQQRLRLLAPSVVPKTPMASPTR